MAGPEELTVYNTASETAPGFGVAEIAGGRQVTPGGDSAIEIRKPTGSGELVVIGPASIGSEKYGAAFRGTVFARYAGSDPSSGDALQAKADQWELESDGAGTSVSVAGDNRTLGTAPDEYKITRVYVGSGSTPTVRTGIVKTATAATWSNSGGKHGDGQTTPGTLEAWPEDADGDIDRDGEFVTLDFDYTEAPSTGARVKWIGEHVIAWTCDPMGGFV